MSYSIKSYLLLCAVSSVLTPITGTIGYASAQRIPVPSVRLPPGVPAEHRLELERRFALETDAVIELRAVSEVGGEPVALIDVDGHPLMAQTGSVLAGWQVRAITVAAQQVVLLHVREIGARTLNITNYRSVVFPEISKAQVERLIEAGSTSPHNWRETHMTPEVLRVWPKINREAQEAILLNYLRQGWVVGCVVLGGESVASVYHGRLWETDRRELRTEKRQAFLASLSETQRKAFTAIVVAPPVDLRNPPPPAELERMRAWFENQEMEKQKVVVTLNPEQRALYEAYMAVMGQPPNR